MIRSLILCAALALLTGCATLATFLPEMLSSEKPAISADLQIGDNDYKGSEKGHIETDEVNGDLNSTTTDISGGQVSGADRVTINNGIPFWQVALLGFFMFTSMIFGSLTFWHMKRPSWARRNE